MADQTFASLLISSEVVSGQRIAEVLHLRPTKMFVKGTPADPGSLPQDGITPLDYVFAIDVAADTRGPVSPLKG
jgi:hypothetical protein